MSLIYTLANSIIDDDDIMVYGKDTQVMSKGGNMLASEREIILNNIDPTKYSPLESGSLFFGTSWYNDPATIHDSVTDIIQWDGRIKKISFSDSDNKLKVNTTNFVQDMVDKTCVYDNTSDADETPSQVVYNMLSTLISVPDSNIDLGRFVNAFSIQDTAGAYLKVNYTKEDGKKVFSVIEEICRLSLMDLSVSNNIFYIYQYTDWDGLIGREVKNIVENSFKFYTEDKNIANDYSVAFKDGANVGYAIGSDSASQSLYENEVSFLVPNQSIDSSLIADHKMYYKDTNGASWAGDLALTRYKYLKYMCEFKLPNYDKKWDDAFTGDQLDLAFNSFIREPVRIISIGKDKDNPEVSIKAEFLNLPVNVISRDETAPFPVIIESAIGGFENITLRFSISDEADHLGYLVYFTTTPGMWEQEECNWGKSPIDLKTPDTTPDGQNSFTLYELNPGTTYYFKITSYDNSFNESEDSNVISAIPVDNTPDMYMVQQSSIGVVTLDDSNSESGTPISGNALYDSAIFDTDVFSYCAHWKSIEYYKENGFSSVSWIGVGDLNDIKYQIRYSSDGVTWQDWTILTDAIGNKELELDNSYPYFQIRFLFYSRVWSDSDYIYIKGIN